MDFAVAILEASPTTDSFKTTGRRVAALRNRADSGKCAVTAATRRLVPPATARQGLLKTPDYQPRKRRPAEDTTRLPDSAQ